MPRPKRNEWERHSINFRPSDFDRMGELFPAKGPSVAIRELVAAFIDKSHAAHPTPTIRTNIEGLTDE